MRFTLSTCLGVAMVATAAAGCANDQVTNPRTPTMRSSHWDTKCDASVNGACALGRMTGGGNAISVGDGIKITKGFTLHCDITLSNNLEVNWPGHSWHLDKPITLAECVDQPGIDPAPPPAPFDTFYGEAIGTLDGVPGSYIQFQFVDAGEPGGHNDTIYLQIWTPGGVHILDLPEQFITGGNNQAHYDQPHGNKP